MPTTPASTKDLPLPVRIFRAAMEQQRSLADYAHSLDMSADSLRAIITAQLDQLEPGVLDRLAEIYQQSRETLRPQLSIPAPQEPFAAWLKRNMEGISQHSLRTRVQLDTKTLKQFLNGELLPDSDQAERLARALYIDRTELAQVVTATMIHQANAEHLVDTPSTSPDQLKPSLAMSAEPAAIRSSRTRRPKATPQAEQTAAEGAAANGSTKSAGTVRAAGTEPEADIARRPAARRQAGTKTPAPPASPATTSSINGAPAPEIEPARLPAADRQTGTVMAAASDTTPTDQVDVMSRRDQPAAITTAALAPPPATIPSVVADDPTTLLLSADEVRLIRHWRQLHPHGRRATLHYIGSLLVDD